MGAMLHERSPNRDYGTVSNDRSMCCVDGASRGSQCDASHVVPFCVSLLFLSGLGGGRRWGRVLGVTHNRCVEVDESRSSDVR